MLLTWNVWNCIQWLEMDFLNYLDKWDTSVQSRPDFTLAEMKKMKLSDETLEGLEVTGMTTYIYNYYGIKPFILNCFISCSDIIMICWNGKIHRQPGVKFLLSKWFCQDTFEVFFGHQRAKGGWNSETTLWCNGSLRVQSSAALDPIVEIAVNDLLINSFVLVKPLCQNKSEEASDTSVQCFLNSYNHWNLTYMIVCTTMFYTTLVC